MGSIPTTAPRGRQAARWTGDWSCCCSRIPQSAPEGLFLFEKILVLNPATPSIQGRTCPLMQPTSPARPVLSGSGLPMAQFSTLPGRGPQCPCVYHTSSLFPSLGPQATRSLSVLLKPCLAGERACSLPGILRQALQAWACGCSCPVPCAGPRDLFVL